jgi:hypothetical protein
MSRLIQTCDGCDRIVPVAGWRLCRRCQALLDAGPFAIFDLSTGRVRGKAAR